MCYPTLPQLRPQCSVALLRASTTCHWTTPSLHLIPPLTHQMWGYPAHHCYRDSGTIQLSSQLQWLSSKCEVGSVSFILPLHLQGPRPGKRGKFTPQWNVSKLRFQSSQTFRPSTSAAVLMQLCGFGQKGENSERRMCQSPRIPMPKFSISGVSISHGSSSLKGQDLFSHLLEYFNHLWISILTKL